MALSRAGTRPLRRTPETTSISRRVWLPFVLALVLAVPLASPSAGPPGETTAAATGRGALLFRTDAPASEIAAVGATVLETYDGFAVARGPASAVASLAAHGRRADLLGDRATLRLQGGDTVLGGRAPVAVATWPRDGRGRAVGFVHFHAPVKASWRDDLAERGIEVLRYVPEDAYLIRGNPANLARAESLPFVDWVGPLETTQKLRPSLASATGVVDVRILLLPGEGADVVEAWLGHRGIPPGDRKGSHPGVVGAFGSGDFQWVRARVPATLLGDIASIPDVEFVEPAIEPKPANEQTDWVLQTDLIGNTRYWSSGLDGSGQVVAISDTGLDFDGEFFRQSVPVIADRDIYNSTDLGRRKVVRYVPMGIVDGQVSWPGGTQPWDPYAIMDSAHSAPFPNCTLGHGTAVASVLTGNDDGIGFSTNDGLAKGASLYVEDIGTVALKNSCWSDDLAYIPEDFTELFGPTGLVYNDPVAPVRIHSNSWGSATGAYDIQARLVDSFVWTHPDFTVLFAAGNTGPAPSSIESPGTAKNAVTAGGAGNPDGLLAGDENSLASLSSRGPTTDGRIKPTILTIFDGDSAMSDGNTWDGVGDGLDHWQGTSYATPAAAAAAAIIRQYFMEGWYPYGSRTPATSLTPSAALVRAMLVASGVQITGTDSVRPGVDAWPNNEQGFGRVLLSNVLPLASAGDSFRLQVVDDAKGLLTGEVATQTFRVIDGSRPVRFVLAWSDYPAAVGASKALVNDLDLEVISPNGTAYRGNHFGTFAQGQSLPGGSFDSTNVEEEVLVKAPLAGDWTVRILGSDVPIGPQPYALVGTGRLETGWGRVMLDRAEYGERDRVGVTVEDGNASSVSVTATSTVEPAGEVASLAPGTTAGQWVGSLPTAFGPASSGDGILQVRDGDTITVHYADDAPSHGAAATARVDAAPPIVSGVTADRPDSVSVRIGWVTDEPATTKVLYGTSAVDLSLSAGDADLRVDHELVLTGLRRDTLYYFDVSSEDRYGHETRDDAGGRHHRFRTGAFGDVLLVIGDESFPEDRVTSYASALDSTGWTWSLWRIADSGPPPLAVLRAHRAIIWQVGLDEYPPFSSAEQTLVKTYLDDGGRLLVSSHDTAWALDSPDSRWYSAANASWVQGTLKASFSCDPSDVGQMKGLTGDPLSGAFAAGVVYTAHRQGGADDELGPRFAGERRTTVWYDDMVSGACPGNEASGIRWASSVPNGTAGTGVWGGTPSRLVYFAFELTGLDATSTDLRPTSPARAAVLDNSLRWLVGNATSTLDRDHPDIRILTPNAGSFAATSVRIDWTATATAAVVARVAIDMSPDGGQTWQRVDVVNGFFTSYAWDVSHLPNGNRYLLRLTATDSGSPPLRGQDESDGTLTLLRVGNDDTGPAMVPGSVRVSPSPFVVGAAAWFNGTADDSGTGGSAIIAAEFFLNDTEPAPWEAGTGVPIGTADGSFGGVFENLAWSGTFATAPGASCVWLHALDASGTWGAFGSACFVVLSGGADTTPPTPASLLPIRLANGGADIVILWSRTWDEGQYGGTTAYRVLRSSSAQGAGVEIANVTATGQDAYNLTDSGRGVADPNDYFYRVVSVDAAGNNGTASALAAKVRRAVVAGPNLLGLSLQPETASLAGLSVETTWSSSWSYDACAGDFGWGSAVPGQEAVLPLGLGRGFWLNATGAGDVLSLGIVHATARVALCEGWNLLALPGFHPGVTVAQLKAATTADAVQGADSANPYGTRTLADADVLMPGTGYWVHLPASVTWAVPGW